MSEFTVLVVDDEYLKIEKISELLQEFNVIESNICHVTTLSNARRELSKRKYNLLILDLKIPSSLGDSPKEGGGLEFLSGLNVSGTNIHRPDYILGLTARDESLEQYKDSFNALGWILEKYTTSSNKWEATLKNIVRYQCNLEAVRSKEIPRKFDIAVVTALHDPEFQAVLNLDCGWSTFRIPGDPTIYKAGEISSAHGCFSVIAAHSSRKGMPSSAALAMKIALTFKPEYLVMLGICAGIKSATDIGDVIIGDPTWDWGSGKHKVIDGSEVFNIAPVQASVSSELRAAFQELSRSGEAIDYIRAHWKGATPGNIPTIKLGPMASGAGVLADKGMVQQIKDGQNKDVVAIEMEAYAVMSAMEYAISPPPKSLIIKSVCDFADENKGDEWQKYASYTSATTFYYFFMDMLRGKSIN